MIEEVYAPTNNEHINALRALLVGVKGIINDEPLPLGHPDHEAYLRIVAIPKAEESLKLIETN